MLDLILRLIGNTVNFFCNVTFYLTMIHFAFRKYFLETKDKLFAFIKNEITLLCSIRDINSLKNHTLRNWYRLQLLVIWIIRKFFP